MTRRRLITLLVGIIALAATGVGVAAAQRNGSSASPADGDATTTAAPTLSTTTISREDLTESTDTVGGVSYGDSWTAPIESQGVVTARHEKGHIVEPGDALIWVDQKPVTLAEGTTPMYRALSYALDENKKRINGDDVSQLQQFLLDQGYDDKERLTVDGVFGRSTERAVKEWQKATGLLVTGEIDRSQLVFHPRAVRIAGEPRVGATFTVLEVTDADQRVKALFDRKKTAFVEEGGTVDLDLGDGTTFSGRITGVETTLSDTGERRLTVTVEPSRAIPESIDRVSVIATRTAAADALVVPARAVLALAGGGYAVERPTGELVRVELGEVVDDNVAITGDVSEGDAVVVPRDILEEAS